LSKGAFISQERRNFQLIESFRLDNGMYPLLDRHLVRLAASADYFAFRCDPGKIRQELAECAARTSGLNKVRLLLSPDGNIELTSEKISETAEPLRVGISPARVNSGDRFCYHKTTRRENLDAARSSRPDCTEVLLLNEHGQFTEGSYHTLIVKLDGRLVTPPLFCGLLPGVLREELLARGEITEQVLVAADLGRAGELWLVNSVRGWRQFVVV
jgi:para-aminobenzoate synthetase/4-amino-4-deoxychorismate lyase